MGYEYPSGDYEKEKGSLYRLDLNSKLDRCQDKVNISNGLAWTEDSKIMYYADSPIKNVYAYDFDAESGKISKLNIQCKI